MANFSEAVLPDTVGALHAVAARAAAQMGDENFPVALRVLPKAVGADLAAVYRFARFVDDVGDDHAVTARTRLERLDVIADDIGNLATGCAVLPPVTGLAALVHDYDVPPGLLLDLVEANRLDQRVATYGTFGDLLDYCRYSAAPVGRIVLHRAAAATPRNVADSDSVCAALQVLEHCQDVAEDARAGRVYLPGADLQRAGVDTGELIGSVTSPVLRRVVAIQVARARELLRPGRQLVAGLRGWARIAVAGYVAGGLATADALQAAGFGVLETTVRPTTAGTVRHTVRLLGRRS